MIVSIAGPIANLVMAFIGYVVMRCLEAANLLGNDSLYLVLFLIVVYNINFAILNLMPVPPLDGSHILMNFLPLKWQIHVARFSMVSLLILIVILIHRLLRTSLCPCKNRFSVLLKVSLTWCYNPIKQPFKLKKAIS